MPPHGSHTCPGHFSVLQWPFWCFPGNRFFKLISTEVLREVPWASHAVYLGGVPFLGGLATWSSISPLAFHPSLASLHAYRHAPDDHCHAKIAQNLNSHSVATPPSFPCAQETYKMPGKGLSNSWDLDLSLTRQELNNVIHVENNMLFQQPRLDEASLDAAASQQPLLVVVLFV